MAQEAIRLRVEERLGIRQICQQTGLSQGTVSNQLRPYPLAAEELKRRFASSATRTNATKGRYAVEVSRWANVLADQNLSREQKGQIAEAAVLFRLAIHGFHVWKAQYDGNPADWLVSRPGGRQHVRIQVRWAARSHYGRPLIKLRRRKGRTHVSLTSADCDFVVGYDLETDTAFVFPVAEIEHRQRKACDPQHAESWQMLGL